MTKSNIISIQCYSGYKANERPISFNLGNKSFEIEEIIDKWYGEDYTYFKLRADDGNTYILKYNEHNDEWKLNFFRNSKLEKF